MQESHAILTAKDKHEKTGRWGIIQRHEEITCHLWSLAGTGFENRTYIEWYGAEFETAFEDALGGGN